jgi:hypothetical protein
MALLLASILLIAVLVLSVFTLHKVKAIHKATYRLLDDAETARKEAEALYGQLQATAALQQLLSLTAPLPPMPRLGGFTRLSAASCRAPARQPGRGGAGVQFWCIDLGGSSLPPTARQGACLEP